MAETSTEFSRSSFFCHACERRISPVLPNYECPLCHGGFVELVDDQSPEENMEQDDNVGPTVFDALREFMTGAGGSGIFTREYRRRHPAQNHRGTGADGPLPTSHSSDSDGLVRPTPQHASSSTPAIGPDGHLAQQPQAPGVRRLTFSTGPGNVQIGVRTSASEADFPWLQDLVNIVLGAGWQIDAVGSRGGGSSGGIPIMFNLPGGNLSDYAWGQQGLDNVVTQLLNQIEGQGGAPPLSKEEIEAIPRTEVTQSMKDKSSQCSVCMDDFAVGESVRRLTCDHFFHERCIVPWVERHATCPVCRKELGSNQAEASAPRLPDLENLLSQQRRANPEPAEPRRTSRGRQNSSTQSNDDCIIS